METATTKQSEKYFDNLMRDDVKVDVSFSTLPHITKQSVIAIVGAISYISYRFGLKYKYEHGVGVVTVNLTEVYGNELFMLLCKDLQEVFRLKLHYSVYDKSKNSATFEFKNL